VVQNATTLVRFSFDRKMFGIKRSYGYDARFKAEVIVFLELQGTISGCSIDGKATSGSHNATTGDYTISVGRGDGGLYCCYCYSWGEELHA